MKNILLISGGYDSLYIYHKLNKKKKFECIYFDYGQEYLENEIKILNNLNINYSLVKINDLMTEENGFVLGRNLNFFLKLVDMYGKEPINVYVGSNKDDVFADNNRRFFSRLSYILNNSFLSNISIKLPLRKITKKEIVKYIKENNLQAYSCYEKDGPCGKCKACKSLL